VLNPNKTAPLWLAAHIVLHWRIPISVLIPRHKSRRGFWIDAPLQQERADPFPGFVLGFNTQGNWWAYGKKHSKANQSIKQ